MRQSRHLLVANLPDGITENRIIDHFKRFGKVQSVKFLPSSGSNHSGSSSSSPGLCAAVAFTDIRSAAKAFNNPDNKIDEKILKTEYYEPAASGTATSAAIYIHDVRDDALRGGNNNGGSFRENSRATTTTNTAPIPHSSSSSTSSTSSSSSSHNITSISTSNNNTNCLKSEVSALHSSRRGFSSSRSSPPPPLTCTTPSGHIHSRSMSSSSSSSRGKRPISDGTGSVVVGNNNNSSRSHRFDLDDASHDYFEGDDVRSYTPSYSHRRSSEYGTPAESGHHHQSSSHRHHDRGRSFSPSSKMISDNSDSPLRERSLRDIERSPSPASHRMDSYSLQDKRRRASNVRQTSDLDQRRSLIRSTSSPGRYYPEGGGDRPSLNHRDSSVIRPSSNYRGSSTAAPRSPGSSRSSSVISNSSRAEAMELEVDKESHLYPSSRRRSSDAVASLNAESKENSRFYSHAMDPQDPSNSISRDNPPSSTLKRKFSDGDYYTSDQDPSVHVSDRKKRLLEVAKPANLTPNDRQSSTAASPSLILNVHNSSTTTNQLELTRIDPKGDQASLHRHHQHSSSHHASHRLLSKSSSVDSSDENGDIKKIGEAILVALKGEPPDSARLQELLNSGSLGDLGGKNTHDMSVVLSNFLKSSETLSDSSRRSRNRDSSVSNRGRSGSGNPIPKETTRIFHDTTEVNHSLMDPRRKLTTSNLLNSFSSNNETSSSLSSRVDALESEPPLVHSSTDSLPQDVHSTTHKNDDLLHGCEVSSSSDKTTSTPKKTDELMSPLVKVIKLPLTKFGEQVLREGYNKLKELGLSSTSILGTTSLSLYSSLSSPKNTSPINTTSPCPLPPKRVRDRSTDSKGSEVSTSDRDSTENVPFLSSGGKSLDSSSLSDHSDHRKSPRASPSKVIVDQIKAFDEKYSHVWNTTTNTPSAPSSAITAAVGILSNTPSSNIRSELPTRTIDYSKYNIKKKSQGANQSGGLTGESQKNEPSDITKNLLQKSSIFDQDSRRLERISEKFEPAKDGSQVAVPNDQHHHESSSASTSSSSSSSSGGNVSNKIPFRTKAAAKEFPTASATSSLSSPGVSKTGSSVSPGLAGLASLSRKMSEPSKLPSSITKDTSTVQSAPPRSFSTAFSPFSAFSDKKGDPRGTNSLGSKDPRSRDSSAPSGESRDPRTQQQKPSLVSSASVEEKRTTTTTTERASIQKSLSMPTGAKSTLPTPSTSLLMKSENRTSSSSSLPPPKEHEGNNKRRTSTEVMEVDGDVPSGKSEIAKVSSALSSSKNSSSTPKISSTKESSLHPKAENQSSVKRKDKGDKEQGKATKGNEGGKQSSSLPILVSKQGDKIKSKAIDSAISSTATISAKKEGTKTEKQTITGTPPGKSSSALSPSKGKAGQEKEKAKTLKDKIMESKKSNKESLPDATKRSKEDNKRRNSSEAMEDDEDAPSAKSEGAKPFSTLSSKNSSSVGKTPSTKESTVHPKNENQSTIKKKDKGDKEQVKVKGNDGGKQSSLPTPASKQGDKMKSKTGDSATSSSSAISTKTGIKAEKQTNTSIPSGKSSSSTASPSKGKSGQEKEKAKTLKDKMMDNKKSNNKESSHDASKKSSKDSKSSKYSKESSSSPKKTSSSGNQQPKEKKQEESKTKEQLEEEKKIRKARRELAILGVTEEPVYLSMYDKVKQRSSANQSQQKTDPFHPTPASRGRTPSTQDKAKVDSDSSDSDDSDDEDDDDDSSSDSSSDEDDRRVSLKKKRKPVIESSSSSSSDDNDDEDDDDEEITRKKKISTSSSSSSSIKRSSPKGVKKGKSVNRSKPPIKTSDSSKAKMTSSGMGTTTSKLATKTQKKVKDGKEVRRKDVGGSSTKEKNSSKPSPIHRSSLSSQLKATSSESLSSASTTPSDQEMKSDSESDVHFRKLESTQNDSSDERSSDHSLPIKAGGIKATSGVISHTEWEKSSCSKVISSSSTAKGLSALKKDKLGGHVSTQVLDKKSSSNLNRFSSETLEVKSKSLLLSTSPPTSSFEKKTSSSHKKGIRDDERSSKHFDRLKEDFSSRTSSTFLSKSSAIPDAAKSSPPIVSSSSDSLPLPHRFKSPDPDSPIRIMRDDSSDSLDQDIFEKARQTAAKAERYQDDSDSSSDDLIISRSPNALISPLGRSNSSLKGEDSSKERPTRSFDQEAAIEASRLEVELNQSWKKPEVPFDDLICSTTPSVIPGPPTHVSPTLHEGSLGKLSVHIPGTTTGLDVKPSPSHLLHPELSSEELAVESIPSSDKTRDGGDTIKEETGEVDNQRSNEVDLAVNALLQEMDEKEVPTIEVPETEMEDMQPYELMPDDEPPPLQISEEPSLETHRQQTHSLHLSLPTFDPSKDSSLHHHHHRPDTGRVNVDSISASTLDILGSSSCIRTPIPTPVPAPAPDELSIDRSTYEQSRQEQMKERLPLSSVLPHASILVPPPNSSPTKRLTADPISSMFGEGKEKHDLIGISQAPSISPSTNFLHVSTGYKENAPSDDETAKSALNESDVSKDDDEKESPESGNDRPKRGRRPKTRKFSESGLVMPRYEGSAQEASQVKEQQPASLLLPSNRQTRRSAVPSTNPDKVRRSPRVASIEPESTSTTSLQTSGEEGSGDEKDGEARRRRSSRRKKTSGDSAQKTSSESTTSIENSSLKTPTKEGRLLANRHPRGEGDKNSEQNRKSAYDVFEFTDEEDESGPPPKPLHETMHSKGLPEHVHQKEDKKAPAHDDSEDHERDSEISNHVPKISIKIRPNYDTGTLEVIKTSTGVISSPDETSNPPPSSGQAPLVTSLSSSTVCKVNAKSSGIGGILPPASSSSTVTATATVTTPATTLTQAEQEAAEVKATRKSARLQNQNKSTVDEVIEDVIKGKKGEGVRRLQQRGMRRSGEENNLTMSGSSTAGLPGDSNDEELSEDMEGSSNKESRGEGKSDRHSRTYRITRSSTRGSIASEETGDASSSSASMFDETSSHSTTNVSACVVTAASAAQPGTRRHSHPTPSKDTKSSDHPSQTIRDDSSPLAKTDTTAAAAVSLETPLHQQTLPPSVSSIHVSETSAASISTTSIVDKKEAVELSNSEQQQTAEGHVAPLFHPAPPTTSVLVQSSATTSVQASSVSQEPMRPFIPSVSERIHNSTTAQKLKTGKAYLHLTDQDLSKSSFSIQGLTSVQATVKTDVPPLTSSLENQQQHDSLAKNEVRVQPPPAHTKITLEPKQPSVMPTYVSPGSSEKTSPVIATGRVSRTPEMIHQVVVPPGPSNLHGHSFDGRTLVPSKEYFMPPDYLRMSREQQPGRPTPPPSSPSIGSNAPDHLRPGGPIPPYMIPSTDMPFNYPYLGFLHQDLARIGPRPPFGPPLPFDPRISTKEDDKNKSSEEQKRREQELVQSILPGLPPHMRTAYQVMGHSRPGNPSHLSPHDRVTDSPVIVSHGFRHLPLSGDGKGVHEIGLHSPAAKSMGHLGSPAPGFHDNRTGQPVHSPVCRPKVPSPNVQRLEEDRGKVGHHVSPFQKDNPLTPGYPTNFGLPPHMPHYLSSMEDGHLRRGLPPMPHEATNAPLTGHVMQSYPPVPQTPPKAQVPSSDSNIMERYPKVWEGLMSLKVDQAAVQMHFISGHDGIHRKALPSCGIDGQPAPIKISQRMRMEQPQLEQVSRKMQMLDEHCILVALPQGRNQLEVLQQSNNLKNGFITYLRSKQAAGIVNVIPPNKEDPTHVIHIFPSSEFADGHLARIAPDLLHSISDVAYMFIVITTTNV